MSTLGKPEVKIPASITKDEWVSRFTWEGDEAVFEVVENRRSGEPRQIRVMGIRSVCLNEGQALRTRHCLTLLQGMATWPNGETPALVATRSLVEEIGGMPHDVLLLLCKYMSNGNHYGFLAAVIPVLEAASQRRNAGMSYGTEYIKTMIIEQGLYGRYERLVLEMSTGRKLVIKGKDLGAGESKSGAAREFEVLQGLCTVNNAWDKIAYQLKWMRWIPHDCLIHIFNLHDKFEMGLASNAKRAKDSGYTGMLVHFAEPVASTVVMSSEAIKMLEEKRKEEIEAALKTAQLKALEERYKKEALGMPSFRFKELAKELTDRSEPKKEVITMAAAETTKAESSVWTSMWNTTQKEMGDGVWRTTAEQTVRLLREPFMAAITKKMGSGAGLVVGSVLETEVGEGAFAMAIGGALGGMLYTLPAIDSKKAQRLAAELRTFGWHKSTSFLVELFMVHIRGKLVTIIAGLPEVEADWVAPEPGMFGVSAKVPSAKEKVAVEAP